MCCGCSPETFSKPGTSLLRYLSWANIGCWYWNCEHYERGPKRTCFFSMHRCIQGVLIISRGHQPGIIRRPISMVLYCDDFAIQSHLHCGRFFTVPIATVHAGCGHSKLNVQSGGTIFLEMMLAHWRYFILHCLQPACICITSKGQFPWKSR